MRCEYCKEEVEEEIYYSISQHFGGMGRSKFYHQLCFEIIAGPDHMFDPATAPKPVKTEMETLTTLAETLGVKVL